MNGDRHDQVAPNPSPARRAGLPGKPGQRAQPGPGGQKLKEIATVQGVRANQLTGYGLVVGLDGTGDQTTKRLSPLSLQAMLPADGRDAARRKTHHAAEERGRCPE